MIKNIGSGKGIQINSSYSSWPSFYGNSGHLGAGNMRYNGSNQNIEVFDGTSWLTISSGHPTIELNGYSQVAIEWAHKKMAEEADLAKLAELHPTVADALLARDRAEDAVRIAAALCKVDK